MTRFSGAWRRFWNIEKKEEKTENDEKEKRYEFYELLNLIEVSCLLWRCGTIKGNPKKMLEDKLKEYLAGIFKNNYGRNAFCEAISGPNTFTEIKYFAKECGVKIPE